MLDASSVLAARRLDVPEAGLKRFLKESTDGASAVLAGRRFQSGIVRGIQECLYASVLLRIVLYLYWCEARVLESAGMR